MDVTTRRERARAALDGYVSGPEASTLATARAWARVGDAVTVVVVEGVSDQIAVETAAVAMGRDLEVERAVIVPIGGAHAIGRFVSRLRLRGVSLRLAGLCDLREQEVFRRGLAYRAGPDRARSEVEELGFHVCVHDLEDELIRAVGVPRVEAVVDSQGDLASFRSLQRQPAWRGRPRNAQMRRFLGSGAGRKLRYARLLVEESVAHDALPAPLEALLDAV
jgi:hypothetical protein